MVLTGPVTAHMKERWVMRKIMVAIFAATLFQWVLSTVQAQDSEGAWGAIATDCDGNGSCPNSFTAAYKTGSTQDLAKRNAIADCLGASDTSKCQIVRVFNRGCAYIAVSCARNQCGWAIGTTHDDAVRKLRAKGFNSGNTSPPEGGCVGN